jgi:hypothetical protein
MRGTRMSVATVGQKRKTSDYHEIVRRYTYRIAFSSLENNILVPEARNLFCIHTFYYSMMFVVECNM